MSAPQVHAEPPPAIVSDPEGLQYETGPQLGKGGFAICHRAKLMGHEHLGSNTVALKIVKSRMEPPKLAQKFVTELQIHSKLSHPNIVEFYRAFSFETSTYVVLELCENGSLADAIRKRKYFTMPEIRRFMIQTCGAIKYLHQRNIVHRDLKTGNLFLDGDMNVKVGDFGLAALLVSQSDYGAIRRTTMCGTPNYLAPEVLEKTGKGHDEKVDLWAIGIMMYTLAVGRAPFHAPKREDIYRKLKAREYTWPDLAKFANEITDDLRDIVSLLLVHEDDRPTPDQIVAHPFFRLGHIPLQLESACTSRIPKWPKNKPPTASTIRRGYTEEWWEMCKASAVGEYELGKAFGAHGSRRNKTVARDCQKEIESGKQPNIPFAADTVYLPFPARTHWPFQAAGGLSEIPEEKESSSEGRALVETAANDRTRGRPARVTKREEVMPTLKENNDPTQETETATRTLDKQPTRMRTVRKISNPGRVTAATATTVPLRVPKERVAPKDTRTTLQRTRSTKEATREKEEPIQEAKPETRPLQRTRSTREVSKGDTATEAPQHTRPLQRTRSTRDVSKESKVKADLLPEIKPLRVVKASARVAEKAERATTEFPKAATDSQFRTLGPELPGTDPLAVLARLHTLRENISRALAKKPCNSRRDRAPQLPFVTKWVDYSRRFGVGYVLEDGSVGCVATAKESHPVTLAFSADGHSHLSKLARNPKHAVNIPMQFYAAPKETKGLAPIEMTDKDRLQEIRNIWSKFGKYMCTQLGSDEWAGKKVSQPTNFVKFYQRLSNVGVWGFGDGSFQINFPDHTKMVLSSDGAYCNFVCLSIEATPYKDTDTSDVPFKYVKQREHLRGSLQQLLYGSADKADTYKDITEANLMRTKLEFFNSVVDGWIQGGGLGCLLAPKSFVWTEWNAPDNKRVDWASVGRFGGDVL